MESRNTAMESEDRAPPRASAARTLDRAALEAHFLRPGRDHFQRASDDMAEFDGESGNAPR